jgi:hypothetical protein
MSGEYSEGQENLSGQQREAQDKEPKLPQTEIGQRSYQLIQEFKQALKRTPEYKDACADAVLAETSHKEYDEGWKPNNPLVIDKPIAFIKGDYRYITQYRTENDSEELIVNKVPLKPDEYDWRSDQVWLYTQVNKESRQFDGGYIQPAKRGKDAEVDSLTK